jgi:hypothetical protein
MKGIIRLKSPLELNFEGISEIKKPGQEEQELHHFPMTTKFINLELTRSRAGTNDTRQTKNSKPKTFNLDSSNLSLEKKKEELSKLFKENMKKKSELMSPKVNKSQPDSEKVEKRFSKLKI